MQLPKFSYLKVSSLEEATRLMAAPNAGVCLVAGGTELFPRMKYGLAHPKQLIRLNGVPVQPPTAAGDGSVALDAFMTLTAVNQSRLIREKAPILATAAAAVGSNEIRNMATLGGNLCQESRCLYYNQKHDFQYLAPCFKRGGDQCYFIPQSKKCWAVFMADTAPALICLGAEAKIIGPAGSRKMVLENLYRKDPQRPLTLAPGEALAQVRIPAPPRHRGQAFAKISWRGGFEYSAMSVAAVLDMEADGRTCLNSRIAVGSIASSPLRPRKAEAILAKERMGSDLLATAADLAAQELQPVPHHGYSRAYLTECLRVQIRRVLASALDNYNGA